jgi:hypothetical protein
MTTKKNKVQNANAVKRKAAQGKGDGGLDPEHDMRAAAQGRDGGQTDGALLQAAHCHD